MTDMKLCPFAGCGGKGEIDTILTLDADEKPIVIYSVSCDVCGAVGHYAESEELAIDFWNDRVDDALIAELAAALAIARCHGQRLMEICDDPPTSPALKQLQQDLQDIDALQIRVKGGDK